MPFKKRRLPQWKPFSQFFPKKLTITSTLKNGSLTSHRTSFVRLSVFFKQILKLKFYFKLFCARYTKVYASPLLVSFRFLKTKNARMGKGKGPSRTFFIAFFPHKPLLNFLGKGFLFFSAFDSFLKKRLFHFFFFCFLVLTACRYRGCLVPKLKFFKNCLVSLHTDLVVKLVDTHINGGTCY